MFPFNLFKKKKKFEDIPQEQPEFSQSNQQPQFTELRQDDSDDLVNSKLDTINAKLDNIDMRLRKIEELASQ